jgi:hypothetical protein
MQQGRESHASIRALFHVLSPALSLAVFVLRLCFDVTGTRDSRRNRAAIQSA